jgi:hypothetical protein
MTVNKAVLIFPFIGFSLIAAVWSGWIRIGWDMPVSNMAVQHGALMVNSFLASLIFLERAVTFRSKWVLLLPFINAISVLAFVFHLPHVAELIFVLGSSGFVAMCVYFIYRFKEPYYYVFLAGAFCLLTGNIVLYKTAFYPSAVTWWIGFLLFTIVAERLELSRFLSLTYFKRTLLWLCLLGVLIALVWPFHWKGNIALAIAIGATAVWLLKYDMARHSIKIKGQHRYSGILLIAGYVWLLVMSILLIFQQRLSFGYDALLHSFFIGFIFSMIFSHAVIILPAITKLPVKLYRPFLYIWFGLMQASLLVRIIADIMEDALCRKIGGMVNGISILLFFVSIAFIMQSELKKRKSTSLRRPPSKQMSEMLSKAILF